MASKGATYDCIRDAGRSVLANHRARRPVPFGSGRSYGGFAGSAARASTEETQSFEVAFRRYLIEAYTWDLWGAAYVVHGGCSDDGFEYFRRWLVSRGRDVYEAALADPDSLAQLDVRPGADDVWEFEEIYYVAKDVY